MISKEGLVPFFQHAHHRVEGDLLDFQEALVRGQVEVALFDQAVEELLNHMYAEEEAIFPVVAVDAPAPVQDLHREHGRICELVEQIRHLLGAEPDGQALRTLTARLVSVLAAHSAAEDFGIYTDLVDRLGPGRARALLHEVENSRAPAGWVCVARRDRDESQEEPPASS
ncbi:MAG: hemerythrin domain-containing protein [Chloroflexi bacterium]|nr:hemerythrin domain-containing protein [Chloroflexota bacterium]